VSDDLNRDVSRTDMIDAQVAAILRAKSGMERLRLAHEMWELTRDRLTAFLRSYHPEWDKAELQRRVADWLLHGSLAAFVAPHHALSPEGRG
jgi:hypothetical protein